MNRDARLKRLEFVREKHRKQHAIVEALEGEKAPEKSITNAKKLKLRLKDEISTLETMLRAEGVKC